MDFFDFGVTGSVPRTDAQIARAKRNAVGGKRKRCTKGKNCSAACIAAHMVCMVDLPWVVSQALTKTVAKVQAKKGKAPAPKATKVPAATPAPAPQASPAPQKPSFDLNVFKQTVEKQPAATLQSLVDNHSDKLSKDQLKILKDAIKAKAANAPASPAPAPKKQAKKKSTTPKQPSKAQQAALAKVPSVDDYKKWGVSMLESALQNDAPKWNQKSAVTKKVVANMQEAIKQLKAEQAAKAQAATAKPAAASPQKSRKVALDPGDGQSKLNQKAYDAGVTPSDLAVAYFKVAKAKGKSISDPVDEGDLKQVASLVNKHLAGDKTALTMPAPPPKPKPAPAPAAASVTATTPLPKLSTSPAANTPQLSTPDNPLGLSPNQKKIWEAVAFKKPDANYLVRYAMIGNGSSSKNPFLPGTEEHTLKNLVKAAEDLSKNLSTAKMALNANSSTLKSQLPAYMKKAMNEMGEGEVKEAIRSIGNFTGNAYKALRAAQKGPSDRRYKNMSPADRDADIKKWGTEAARMEKLMDYLPKPQVPKFRGVAMTPTDVAALQDLAKNKGVRIEKAMNSWSTETGTAQTFAQDGDSNRNQFVIFRTMNKRGTPIRDISGLPHENELLTKANSRYQFYDYTPVTDGNKTFHVFDVVEF